jgi:ABC-2 type transport system permease protein
MKRLFASLWAEGLKICKSKVFWITIVFFIFIPCMMSLLLVVQKYPEIAGKLGMIGTKASMLRLGNGDWQSFFDLLTQAIAAIGLIGYGFVTSWVFGREYMDHTIKDILALPLSRSYIVVSKVLATVVWCVILTLVFILVSLLLGHIIGLSGWSRGMITANLVKYSIVSILSILLITPVAFFASYSRGVMLPIGFIILTLIIANFTGMVGLGPYFPWAIPGIISVPPGTEGSQITTVSYIILILTSISGLAGTLAWWRFADQK